MTINQKQRYVREKRWDKSRRAEKQGNYEKALRIHQQILAEDQASYASCMRAGWLLYKLGAYEKSLRFYERAAAMTDDEWPLQGIMNCRTALGNGDAVAPTVDHVMEQNAGKSLPRSHKPQALRETLKK